MKFIWNHRTRDLRSICNRMVVLSKKLSVMKIYDMHYSKFFKSQLEDLPLILKALWTTCKLHILHSINWGKYTFLSSYKRCNDLKLTDVSDIFRDADKCLIGIIDFQYLTLSMFSIWSQYLMFRSNWLDLFH